MSWLLGKSIRRIAQSEFLPKTSANSSRLLPAAIVIALLPVAPASAADLDACRALFIRGKFDDCRAMAKEAIENRTYGESWRVLKARAEFERGKYLEALQTVEDGLKRYSWSIQLRLIGWKAGLHVGKPEAEEQYLGEINRMVTNSPWRYSDPDDLVALGRMAIEVGADAKAVLEKFYDRAKKANSNHRDPWIASGELALDKNDRGLAADTFSEALKKFPEDPDVLFGLARAIGSTDPPRAAELLEKTLALNPHHIPALLHQVDHLIDSEKYGQAGEIIAQVVEINEHRPEAWAYRAVIAHLKGNDKQEQLFRDTALSTWRENPEVDYLIGRKLSEKYRFTEGAAYQRSAIKFDPDFLPARVQLCQDLLRLGREEEGWTLAELAHDEDGYNTLTFNLLNLQDALSKFRTIENDNFILRMDTREADIYGQRVLKLLERARKTLCAKYGLKLDEKVIVEIFPSEDDFAVRTFGMPAVSGFLGVCFGRVITANSPASQSENPSNWESVLWHEFCHVVTLQLTRNKMPRWLSEGISVYEELQENETWGQRMNPRYRQMILEGDALTPVGELSAAFLQPESGLHLQFAYFESALVVEYLINEHGIETLRDILSDLRSGLPINDTLDRHTDGLQKLEEDFEAFATKKAKSLAPDAEWESPDLAALLNDDDDALADWLKEHPNNYPAVTAQAMLALKEDRFEDVIESAKHLLELYPHDSGSDSAWLMLARAYRELERTDDEYQALSEFAKISSDGIPCYLRMLEIETAAKDWKGVLATARRILAVNPLLPQTYRAITEAAESVGADDAAIDAWTTLLAMEPEDLAEANFRLAQLLHAKQDPRAKRHVLLALEEAPRFSSRPSTTAEDDSRAALSQR